MRVLVVSSYPPRHCGIGAYARDQVARLRAEGHLVTVLSPPDGEGDVRAEFVGGRAFRRAAAMAPGFDRVVVHFQPALYFAPRAAVSKVLTSASLLWLVLRRHNVEILVHEADRPIRWRPDYALLRMAFRTASRLVFHTEAERASLERDYRIAVRGTVIRHEAAAVAPPVPREVARERLGIGGAAEPVFVCAGFLQPSKGFDRAVRAFPAAGGGSLFVVGSVRDRTPENEAYAAELRASCERTSGAAFDERFLSDQDFDRWVAAADWLVLPYRRAWSSGVLARAQAIGTPAIVTAAGGLAEQAGPNDVVATSDEELATALRDAVGRVRAGGGVRR